MVRSFGWLMALALGWPVVGFAYDSYTYTSGNDNYHLTQTSLSDDGSVIIGIGGTSVVASDEVVVFSVDDDNPVWNWDDNGDDRIFDVDVSGDGSTAVACGSSVWLLDIEQQELLWTYGEDDIYVWDTCDISEDGQTIVAGNRQSSIGSWDRSSSDYVRWWTLTDGGFVDVVDMTEDGKTAIVSNGYSYALIDLSSDEFVWEKETSVSITTVGLNANATRGYAIVDDGETGTDVSILRGINMTTGRLTWKKRFRSTNTPRVQMSSNGKRVMLTTNKKYYGLGSTGKQEWTFVPSGQETSMQMSANGDFVVVAEGLYYVYFFDWDYPRGKHRAFQIDRPTFPGSVGVSADGSTVAYKDEDFVVQQVVPGILVDNLDTIPVYSSGSSMDVRYYVSNPGKKANLKIRTSLSLPQVSILSDLGAEVDGDPKGAKSKLLEYANATLPGYEVIDTRSVAMVAHDSKTITPTLTVPEMVLPDWVGDFLELIGLDDVFASLMGDYSDPMKDLMNDKINDALTSGAEDAVSAGQATYALLGLGQVELYDETTNEVYSTDSFFFMYLVL